MSVLFLKCCRWPGLWLRATVRVRPDSDDKLQLSRGLFSAQPMPGRHCLPLLPSKSHDSEWIADLCSNGLMDVHCPLE